MKQRLCLIHGKITLIKPNTFIIVNMKPPAADNFKEYKTKQIPKNNIL